MDDRYMTVKEVEDALSNIASAHASKCELITLGNLTHEGRTCHAIRLSNAPANNKPILMLTGGVHAREWGSCEILINFISDLLGALDRKAGPAGLSYGHMAFTPEELTKILDQIDILVFPLVNPDGRDLSRNHPFENGPNGAGMWRKNRRPPPNPHSNPPPEPECWGVDLNRNYDFLFNIEKAFSPAAVKHVQASTKPCDFEVYQGPEPFSEPETRNVRSLLDSHPSVRWLVDIHSFSEDVLFSWGDDNTQTTDPEKSFLNPACDGKRGIDTDPEYGEFCAPADLDAGKALAQSFSGSANRVRGTLYGPFQSFELYPTCGTITDYAYSRHLVTPSLGKIIAATVEWGREFQPLWAEMKLIIADVTAGLLGVCLHLANETTPVTSPGVVHGIPGMVLSSNSDRPQELSFEFATPLAEGGIDHWRKHYDQPGESTFWERRARFAKTEAVAALSMIQSYSGPEFRLGTLELIARLGFRLAHFSCDYSSLVWHGPTFLPQFNEGEMRARGNPTLIQSASQPGDLQVVTPLAGGGLAHFSRGCDPASPWQGPHLFGGEELVDALSMAEGTWDAHPLEVVARINDLIVEYSRPTIDSPWVGPKTIISPGETDLTPVGNPALVIRQFNEPGQFELVTPVADNTLAHFTRTQPGEPWSINPTKFGVGQEHRPFDAVTMIARWNEPDTLDVIARASSHFRRYIRDQSGWREDTTPGPG
ncbi:M14 family zinc carboxypeptidase [Streptomyces sp. NPDC056004]|uniref:M14 family zinc carboxypeptidase n=1 Tax=Streptomyces sp. NPDC056004 TaxID=3345677 RepID=UPI0035E10ED9